MKYVCDLCGMIYDETLGDASRGIPAGTLFADLPDYACPRCGSELEVFRAPTVQRRILRTGIGNVAFWENVKYSDLCFESDR